MNQAPNPLLPQCVSDSLPSRLWVVGACGAGKSTLARQLAQIVGGRAVDLDELHWRPHWQEAHESEFRELIERALEEPAWVVAGNYSRTQIAYLPRAGAIIWLDYSFTFVLGRLLKRSLLRIIFRESCCNGNYETWGRLFSDDSILLWLFRSYPRRKKQMQETLANPAFSHLRLYQFRHPRETQRWLESLGEHTSERLT